MEELTRFLFACGRDELVYLPGVGWLTVKRYVPYLGPNPQTPPSPKYLPYFNVDPELARAVNGLPPSGRAFPDERARYLHALHPDLDDPNEDPTLEEESFTVVRLPSADAIAGEIRRKIVDEGRADLPAFGVFEVVAKSGRPGVNPDTGEAIALPARQIVRFKADDQLKKTLAERT